MDLRAVCLVLAIDTYELEVLWWLLNVEDGPRFGIGRVERESGLGERLDGPERTGGRRPWGTMRPG